MLQKGAPPDKFRDLYCNNPIKFYWFLQQNRFLRVNNLCFKVLYLIILGQYPSINQKWKKMPPNIGTESHNKSKMLNLIEHSLISLKY